jgi:hypothetical protein
MNEHRGCLDVASYKPDVFDTSFFMGWSLTIHLESNPVFRSTANGAVVVFMALDLKGCEGNRPNKQHRQGWSTTQLVPGNTVQLKPVRSDLFRRLIQLHS